MRYLTPSDLKRLEKLLTTFQHYTYNHYAVLQLTLAQLADFVNGKPERMDSQTQLDLSFELEHEIEALKQLRFDPNKDEAFALRVKAALSIINRLHPFTDQLPEEATKQKPGLFSRLKRWFK